MDLIGISKKVFKKIILKYTNIPEKTIKKAL